MATLICIACLAALTAGDRRELGPPARVAPSQISHSRVHQLDPTGDEAASLLRHLARSVAVSAPSPVLVGMTIGVQPLEELLSAGTTNLLKGVRSGLRRSARFLRWSAHRWAAWAMRASGFLLIALLAPLLDRGLVASWKENGWRGVRSSILLGLAVHVRLLVDRQAPLLGKMAVALAIAYGVASRDLMPDAAFPVGLVDDLLVIALASRGFILLCPSRMVTQHALRAVRPRQRLRV